MTERRLLAILGFLLALVGGLLLVVSALEFGRFGAITLDSAVRHILELILGVAAIIGGVMMYKGPRANVGGLVTLVIGVLVIIVGPGLGAAAVVIIVAGILGIVGAETRT